MVLFSGAVGVLMFVVWLFCIFDVITTPPAAVRNLPKLVWVLVVIVGVDLGALLWLFAGRPWGPKRAETGPRRFGLGLQDGTSGAGGSRGFGGAGGSPFGGRFGGPAAESSFGPPPRPARSRPMNPDDDEEFLAGLRARAEEQRRRAREADGGQPDADAGPTGG